MTSLLAARVCLFPCVARATTTTITIAPDSSQAVPVEGVRLFVTVDASITAAQNATIKLVLPASPDPGVGMASGNSGPLDMAATNPSSLTFSNADRITLSGIPLPGGSARPGTRQLPVLGLVATSTYTVPRTLTTIVFDNRTAGSGTNDELDGDSRQLTLRIDGNQNGALEGTDVDPVLSTGFFQNGQATFTGLTVTLPAGASRELFLTADLGTTGARDGDIIAAQVTDANDLDFSEATTVAAVWPLECGARWTIDGMIAAQVSNFGAQAATVGPGDGPLLATMVVPRASTVGQTLPVRMIVRNTSNEAVHNVAPSALDLSGGAAFTYLSGPVPAGFDIAPAGVDTVVWTYRADAIGDARFSGIAGGTGFPSNQPRNAPRGAGQLQVDGWDGRNGRGDTVVNGVCVAELDIRLDSGESRHLRRKLAVVR